MRKVVYECEYEEKELKYIIKNVLKVTSSVLTALKNANGIYVNDKPTNVRTVCRQGDIVCLKIPYTDNKAIISSGEKCVILYEDDDIICFDKPSGMSTHPSAGHESDTLANSVIDYLRGQESEFHAVTRLDRYTSGIVVVAKNIYSAGVMCTKDFNRSIKKTYHGICRGVPEKECGYIECNIAKSPEGGIKHCVCVNGKYAKTKYELAGLTKNGNGHLKFNLYTGRTHQIRVHMAHIGHPLCDDFLYDKDASQNNIFHLHCAHVEFTHPFTGKSIKISSELPQYFLKK